MLSNKPADTKSNLDEIIEEVENALKGADPETDTYTKMVANLDSLYKLRNTRKKNETELKDWIPVIGSVGGIAVIVLFEAFGHTVASKSLSFVSKLKS